MENLGFGLQITALGMGLVFGLLVLLWALLTLAVRMDRREAETEAAAAAEAVEAAATPASVAAPAVQVSAPDGLDPDLIAAMMVAVVTHKAVRRRQAAPAMRSYWPGSLIYASRWVAAGRARQARNWQRRGK